MKTWDEYKMQTKSCDAEAKKDIEEMEILAAIISTMIDQRQRLGISQRKLSAICNMPQSTIARIESQTAIPNLDTFLRILKPLGLTLTVTNINEA